MIVALECSYDRYVTNFSTELSTASVEKITRYPRQHFI